MKKPLFTLLFMWVALAQADTLDFYHFETAQQQHQFEKLTSELRCLVCQNQSLADSQAPLAADLRDKVAILVQQHASDNKIKQYLQQRYGDFVLYRPPLQTNTVVLWSAPIGLLLIVMLGLLLKLYTRKQRQL